MVAVEREDGRLKVEIKRAHSELEDIKEQMNVYEVGWLVWLCCVAVVCLCV